MHIFLMLLLLGGKLCCPEVEGGLTMQLDAAGEVQSYSVQVCFPLEACHSPHVTEQRKEEKQSIWDPFTFIILPGDFGDLPLSTSFTHTFKHTCT